MKRGRRDEPTSSVRRDEADAVTPSRVGDPRDTPAHETARRLLRLLDATPEQCGRTREEIADFSDDAGGEGCMSEWRRDPDVIGAVVLLGIAATSCPDILERIMHTAPVVVIEVPNADWLDPLRKATASCFGVRSHRSHPKADAAEMRTGAAACRSHAVVVAARTGRGGSSSDVRAATAFREHRALIGISAPSCTGLPGDLLRACEVRLTIGVFDPASVALVVEHIVGTAPSSTTTDEIARAVEPADLRVAIHPARGADGCIDRLAAVISRRQRMKAAPTVPRLDELCGYGAASEWGLAAAEDLRAYARGELDSGALDPGALLIGSPGSGKTLFAAALARQAGVALLSGSLAQWQSAGDGHLGTTLKAMRTFFAEAKKAAPCVALVDEVDSFGDRRRFPDHHRDYGTQVVNGFLECLDGSDRRAGILLIGTANSAEGIDPAIVRSGRFDRTIRIPLPSIQDMSAILRHHLDDDLKNADLAEAARRGLGGTGADCAAWVRRARGRARRAGRSLALDDLLQEIGSESRKVDPDVDRRIAVHEAGHAVVAHMLGMQIGDVVLRMAAAGGDGVASFLLPGSSTRGSFRDLLAILLAGRAAEILLCGSPSAGAAADLEAATAVATNMHCRWGLGERLGVCEADHRPTEVPTIVERELRSASRRAKDLIVAHRVTVELLARALLEHGSLVSAEILAILRSSGIADASVCPPSRLLDVRASPGARNSAVPRRESP